VSLLRQEDLLEGLTEEFVLCRPTLKQWRRQENNLSKQFFNPHLWCHSFKMKNLQSWRRRVMWSKSI